MTRAPALLEDKGFEQRRGLVHQRDHALVEDVGLAAELEQRDTVADVDQRGGGVAGDLALGLERGQQQHPGRNVDVHVGVAVEDLLVLARATLVPGRVVTLLEQVHDRRRGLDAHRLHLLGAPLGPGRVHQLERPHAPAVAPLHRVVDLLGGLADGPGQGRRVVEQRQVDLAEELAGPALEAHGLVDDLGRRAAELPELREVGGLLVAVLAGVEVEREDLALALLVGGLLVEALARLVAEPALVEQALERRAQLHLVVERVVVGRARVPGQGRAEVGDDVADDVEADHVTEPVAARARAPDRLAVELVDLLDRVAAFDRRGEGQQHLADADPVADEVGGVAAQDHALAEGPVGPLGDVVHDRLVGVLARDDLEQVHPPRRVEEVEAEQALARVLGQALGDVTDRDAGGVGRQDRGRLGRGRDLGEQRLLDVETLDDRLDDDVALTHGRRQIVVEVARDQPVAEVRVHQGRRLGLRQGLERAGCELVAGRLRSVGTDALGDDVEQERADACVGEMGSDTCTHRPSTQHGRHQLVRRSIERHGGDHRSPRSAWLQRQKQRSAVGPHLQSRPPRGVAPLAHSIGEGVTRAAGGSTHERGGPEPVE